MVLPLVRWHSSVQEIPEDQWNIMTRCQETPFYKWRWLNAIEQSGSISTNQGWQSCHLALWKGDKPIAFAPLYLKAHSYGEFIFDQSFAHLADELGLNYYPKLIGMSPFSPAQGYRFFFLPGEDQASLTRLMFQAIDAFAIENRILSCNFLYVDYDWAKEAEKEGCAKWINHNSLWLADGKKDFSEYISSFNANQRRNIKKERKAIQKAGLKVTALSGTQLDLNIMHAMHRFYEQHCSRWGVWGSKYLFEDFFERLLDQQLRDNVVLFSAHRGNPNSPIAMSLCVTDGKKLWGRYWGSHEEIPFLHFEVCYYSPIHWALDNNIHSFDPGAGGSHKLRRGFCLQPQVSVHRWYDERLDLLIRSWLNKVNVLKFNEIKAVNADLPFQIANPSLPSIG